MAEAPRKSVGPGFQHGSWSIFSCHLPSEQCFQRSLYNVYTCSQRTCTILYTVQCVLYIAYQPLFYAIYYMSGGCDVMAHNYRENCQPRGHLAGWYAIYQTCPPYIKPVRPYLNPRGAEARAIWHINRASVLHMIYQVLVTLRLTVYGENSPVSAAVRRQPFWRSICHITNLRTIIRLLWWRHNHVTYIYTVYPTSSMLASTAPNLTIWLVIEIQYIHMIHIFLHIAASSVETCLNSELALSLHITHRKYECIEPAIVGRW